MRNEPCEVASVSISTIDSKLDVMNITSKKYFETWCSISIFRGRRTARKTQRANWKNVNQEDDNNNNNNNDNNKITEESFSRDNSANSVSPCTNLVPWKTWTRTPNTESMEFKEHPGYSTQHKRANANFAPDSSSLSLSLVPGRKRTIEGARLTGKRPTNSGIKWRFTYGIEAWGWKMRRSTGADVEPSRFFLASIELESRKGLCSIRADFHSYGKSLRIEFSWNCVRLFFFFLSFSFVGFLYGWRIESMRRIQFEDLILVGWWKQSKSESFF